MTVIRPNSVSGINSITAQANEIKIFKSDGTQGGLMIDGANLNATSGISTVAALTVTGNVSVGGTLTYQDVTNIDSVGVITARNAVVISDDNAIHFRGTAADDADAILRASAGGGQLLINSRNDTIINIDSNNDSTDAHFAIAHGAATGSSTELFRVQEDGKIGVGENSPDRLLHLKAASSTAYSGGSDTADYNFLKIENTTDDKSAGVFFLIGSNGEAAITATEVSDGATDIAFQNRGGGVRSEKVRITSDGYARLTTANARLEWTASSGSNPFIRSIGSGQQELEFNTGGTERLRIDSSGNATFKHKVNIGASHTGGEILSLGKTSGTSYLGFSNGGTHVGFVGYADQLIVGGASNEFSIRSQDDLLFAAGGNTERLRIASDGQATFDKGAVGGANQVIARFQAESSRRLDVVWHDSGSLMGFDTPSSHSYIFKTGGTEKFRITTTGVEVSGTQDGVLNLDTTDGRGSFIRFKENGTTKAWVGCAEGMGGGTSSPNQDDLGLRASRYILCSAGGAERLRIQNTATAVHVKGESALTGTTGDAKGLSLAVNGSASCPLYFGTETHSAQKSIYLNGYWMYIRGHSNEGIRFVFSQGSGTAPRSDQYQFKYNQATRPTGNTTWDGFSDRRAKENVQDVTSALDTIGRLRPVTFDWTNDYADRMNMFNMDKTDSKSYNWFSVKENGYDESRKNNNVGFIAQEFEEVFPKDITETEMQLGDETITDFKTVNFDSLVPMLTKAVQELKAENEALEARIAVLEGS